MVRMRLLDRDKTYIVGFALRNDCGENLHRFMQEHGADMQMCMYYGTPREGHRGATSACHWRSVYTHGAFSFVGRAPDYAVLQTNMVVLCDSGFVVAQDLFNRYDQRDRELECRFTFKGHGLNSPEITVYPWFGRVFGESLDETADQFNRAGNGQIIHE